jgi:hypothetical protein
VIPLPFADDIRKISIKSDLRPAAAEQVVVRARVYFFSFLFFYSIYYSIQWASRRALASKEDGAVPAVAFRFARL